MSTQYPDTGGWAFPQPLTLDGNGQVISSDQFGSGGMTLRDWFAGQALQGYSANPNNTQSVDYDVDNAYMAADAMLRARARKVAPASAEVPGGLPPAPNPAAGNLGSPAEQIQRPRRFALYMDSLGTQYWLQEHEWFDLNSPLNGHRDGLRLVCVAVESFHQ